MFGVLPIIDDNVSPKHVVFIVVDAARYDYLERFHTPHLDDLIKKGVSYKNMIAGTCIAGTNPGLATLSTGLFAKDHGIFSSFEWYDKRKKELVYFYDAEKDILHMDVPTLCDFFKRKNPNAKVCAISTKDRHAILLGGNVLTLSLTPIGSPYLNGMLKMPILVPEFQKTTFHGAKE